MLELREVSVSLGSRRVVEQVSARVERGSLVALVGPNGAGKSTLIRAVAGVLAHDGEILVAGSSRAGLGARARARSVAYVPQRPVLPVSMTVIDYVLLGRAAHHSVLGTTSRLDRLVAAAALERLRLTDLARRRLGELSGGEAQRVVLGRALAQEAPVLVMDEPVTSLDLGHGQLVLELTDELRRDKGLTVLCAIHDLTLAALHAEQLVLLHEGRLVACGKAGDVVTVENLRRFFGAEVEVLAGSHGPVVAPLRLSPAPMPAPPAGNTPRDTPRQDGRVAMAAP